MSDPGDKTPSFILRHLPRRRSQARLALLFEQVWPAVWPALGVAGAYVALALFGVLGRLAPWPRGVVFLATLACVGWLLTRGLRPLRRPGDDEADRRLEAASGLTHRPLATLTDRPAGGDDASAALWRYHRARVASRIGRLRVGMPRPGLAARDQRALRLGLLVALVAGLVVAGPNAPARLLAAVDPGFASGSPSPPPILQMWITAPSYAGIPPSFLDAAGGQATTPAGSKLTMSLTGGLGDPELSFNDAPVPVQALDASSWQAAFTLDQPGHLALHRRGRLLGTWTIALLDNPPPQIAWTAVPGAAARGSETRLPWSVAQRYGVAALRAELHLQARPSAPVLDVPITLPGTPKSATGAAQIDLTPNPWAGLAVTGRLVGRDVSGQTGQSEEARFTLPEHVFRHPLSRALAQIRRRLTVNPDARGQAASDLDAMLDAPEAFDGNEGIYLNLSSIASLLGLRSHDADDDDRQITEAQARLWQLALALDENEVDRTRRAAEEARRAVAEQIEKLKTDKPEDRAADQAELRKRMDALRQAIEKHMAALGEQMRRDHALTRLDQAQARMNGRDLDRMMQRMEERAMQGDPQSAEQQMAEMEQLLKDIERARPNGNEQRKQRTERAKRGKQDLNAVQDLSQRERGLLDHAEQRAQAQDPTLAPGAPAPDDNGQPSPPPGQGAQAPGAGPKDGPQTAPGSSEANGAAGQGAMQPGQSAQGQGQGGAGDPQVQKALRRALGELMQQYGDVSGEVPQSLSDADRAMREAGEALAGHDDQKAADAQRAAIEALQKGGEQMGQQMQMQFGMSDDGDEQDGGDDAGDGQDGQGQNEGQGGRPGAHPGQNNGHDRRDPFGRVTREGGSGAADGEDVRVPDQMEQARTRAIQDELRRRDAERERPKPELDYIDRLLKPF